MAGPQAPRSSLQGGMMFATTLTVRAAMTSSSTRPVPGCASSSADSAAHTSRRW
jgi:hypothetical protein